MKNGKELNVFKMNGSSLDAEAMSIKNEHFKKLSKRIIVPGYSL